MGKATQSAVSKKNPLWIPKNRYYELKYFCLQFGEWQKRRAQLDGIATRENREPTESEAIERAELERKIKSVLVSARLAARDLESYVITGVTKGLSYDVMNARSPIPCCREAYYNAYRKFFYVLDGSRN